MTSTQKQPKFSVSKELEVLFQLVGDLYSKADSNKAVLGLDPITSFRGFELLLRIKSTIQTIQTNEEAQIIAQHLLDTHTIQEVMKTTTPFMTPPSLVFSEDRVYSVFALSELTETQLKFAINILTEQICAEKSASSIISISASSSSRNQSNKVITFSGSFAVDCFVRIGKISRNEAVQIGQELINRGMIAPSPGMSRSSDFHDSPKEFFSITTNEEKCLFCGYVLKRKLSTKEQQNRQQNYHLQQQQQQQQLQTTSNEFWNVRWLLCKEVSDKRVYLYLSARNPKPKSFIRLDDCSTRIISSSTECSTDFNGFEVCTNSKLYLFRAITRKALLVWINVLQSMSPHILEENALFIQAERIMKNSEELRLKSAWKSLSHNVPVVWRTPINASMEQLPQFGQLAQKALNEINSKTEIGQSSPFEIVCNVTEFQRNETDLTEIEQVDMSHSFGSLNLNIKIPDGVTVSSMLLACGFIWIGSDSGQIYISSKSETEKPITFIGINSNHKCRIISLITVNGTRSKTVWSSDNSGVICVFDGLTGRLIQVLTEKKNIPSLLSAGKTGLVFSTGQSIGTVDIWNVDSMTKISSLKLPLGFHESHITSMTPTGENSVFVCIGNDNLFICDGTSRESKRIILGNTNIKLSNIQCITACGKRRFWTSHSFGELVMWELGNDCNEGQAFILRSRESSSIQGKSFKSIANFENVLWSITVGSAFAIEWRGILVPRNCVACTNASIKEICSCASNEGILVATSNNEISLFVPDNKPLKCSIAPENTTKQGNETDASESIEILSNSSSFDNSIEQHSYRLTPRF